MDKTSAISNYYKKFFSAHMKMLNPKEIEKLKEIKKEELEILTKN